MDLFFSTADPRKMLTMLPAMTITCIYIFFNLQRSCRGNAMCDVYSSFRTDFIDTNGFKKNATFDYYFLSVREAVYV